MTGWRWEAGYQPGAVRRALGGDDAPLQPAVQAHAAAAGLPLALMRLDRAELDSHRGREAQQRLVYSLAESTAKRNRKQLRQLLLY